MTRLQRTSRHMKKIRWFWVAVLAALILSGQPARRVLATDARVLPSDEAADIVIDGRPVFQVEPSGRYAARQRVAQANHLLRSLADKKEPVDIEVVERNQQPTLVAGEQYLLTVTNLDVGLDKTPSQQAKDWANHLEVSLRKAQSERDPVHVRNMFLLAGMTLLLATAAHASLGYLYRRSPRYAIAQGISEADDGSPADFRLLESFKLLVMRFGVWAIALGYVSSLFPALRSQRYSLMSDLTASLQSPLFSMGSRAYTLPDMLILLALVGGLFTLVRQSTRMLSNNILKRTSLARGAKAVITQAFRYGAFAVGLLILLQMWGIDLRSVALLSSALGIGIGFGFQDIAKNFGSGLVLLFERSVQVGDFIEIDSHTGTVERIGARSITIRTLDNISVLVPNAHLLDSQVINWNHDHPASRLHLVVGVAYEADSKLVKASLLKAAEENEEVLSFPAPDVFLKDFGESAIDFDLMVWIRSPERHAAIRSALNFRIEEILNELDISIPFPQRDVNLKIQQADSGTADVKAALLEAFGATGKQDSKTAKVVVNSATPKY